MTAAHQASLSFTISQSLLKLMSIESVMSSNHLNLCHSLFLLPSIFPSIRVFSNELALCIRWPRYWSFSFSISSSNEYSGLISFRIDWFDLAVRGTLKSLLQHHNSKASVLQCSAQCKVKSLKTNKKNPPCRVGNSRLIPGWGTKISHSQSPRVTTGEAMCCKKEPTCHYNTGNCF